MFKEHFGEAAQNHTTCDVQELGIKHLRSNVQSSFKHSIDKVKNTSVNPFTDHLLNDCKLNFQDNLISATKEIIDTQLGFVKLSDDEIKAVIATINCNEINDWFTKAWAFKGKIHEKWF